MEICQHRNFVRIRTIKGKTYRKIKCAKSEFVKYPSIYIYIGVDESARVYNLIPMNTCINFF